jgi:hypothetical protein
MQRIVNRKRKFGGVMMSGSEGMQMEVDGAWKETFGDHLDDGVPAELLIGMEAINPDLVGSPGMEQGIKLAIQKMPRHATTIALVGVIANAHAELSKVSPDAAKRFLEFSLRVSAFVEEAEGAAS